MYEQEAMVAQEQYSQADAQVQTLRAERDMLKSSEVRIMQERDSLMREARSQNVLLSNLQAIQVSIHLSELFLLKHWNIEPAESCIFILKHISQ